MAAQVLNGHGNFSYTNNTGQNVRVTFLAISTWSDCKFTVTSAGGQQSYTYAFTDHAVYGKYIGGGDNITHFNHAAMTPGRWGTQIAGVPVELALENGANITFTDGNALFPKYNIIVIPESG